MSATRGRKVIVTPNRQSIEQRRIPTLVGVEPSDTHTPTLKTRESLLDTGPELANQ
jgi:hypothetical protein